MKIPLQVTSRNISLSKAADHTIRSKMAKLETFYDKIMGCRILVEKPHRHHQHGVLHNVRIDMTVPGAELVVKRESHEDLQIAIRDAFDAVRRQLQSYVDKQRQNKKIPENFLVGEDVMFANPV